MDGSFETINPEAIDNALCEYLLGTITSTVPLSICSSHIEGAGHGVFAQEALPSGTEVFRVRAPFVNGTSDPFNTCDNCYSNVTTKFNASGQYTDERLPLMECKRCRSVRYCSKTCQVTAWSTHHKAECKDLLKASEAQHGQEPGPQNRAIKTAFVRLIKKHLRNELNLEEHKALRNLQSHREEYMKDPGYGSFSDSVIPPGALESGPGMSGDESFDIYCKLMTNSISIRQANNEQSLGVALDLFCSMINHSCDPNTFFFFEGNQLRCRTTRPIAAGEEMFISYTDPSYDAESRGKELIDGYSFRCTCDRCKQELMHLDDDMIKVVERKLKMQEDILRSHRDIAVRAMKPASIERHLNSICTVTDPELRCKLGLEDGWPEHLQPMPDTRFYLARLTQSTDTEYSLKTLLKLCFVTFPKIYGGAQGKEWVMTFSLLVFTLRLYIKKNQQFSEWSLVYVVYLKEMAENALVCYGDDTAFVKANQGLLRKETSALDSVQARSPELIEQFRSDQRQMFKWAGIGGMTGVDISTSGLAFC